MEGFLKKIVDRVNILGSIKIKANQTAYRMGSTHFSLNWLWVEDSTFIRFFILGSYVYYSEITDESEKESLLEDLSSPIPSQSQFLGVV